MLFHTGSFCFYWTEPEPKSSSLSNTAQAVTAGCLSTELAERADYQDWEIGQIPFSLL